eukprot:CAMPEP_0119490558 /NCGR_PEP_ID=MMETSP1344-20130328/15694_1 /TAXON_ID=236787 /ORGANISM="Florenciella parvula, Strain CCMP2471" /LENGTH=250 /DNA_ID=CAMNT_0007525735 /DNA_START=76 /DNA_END=828 /DNA_ORIENTATION=+
MSTKAVLAGTAAGVALALVVTELIKRSKRQAPKSIKLEYFPIEAAAEKVRLAFVMTDTPFEDVRIPFKQWGARKATAKYGQMPILTIDGKEIYQSRAMVQYAGKLGDGSLYPEADALLIDEVIGLSDDLARDWMPGLYSGMNPAKFGYDGISDDDKKALVIKMRGKFVSEILPKYLQWFTDLLNATEGPFFCGETITIADLVVLPQLKIFTKGVVDHVPKDVLEAYPVLTTWMAAMLATPKIKAWYDAQK